MNNCHSSKQLPRRSPPLINLCNITRDAGTAATAINLLKSITERLQDWRIPSGGPVVSGRRVEAAPEASSCLLTVGGVLGFLLVRFDGDGRRSLSKATEIAA